MTTITTQKHIVQAALVPDDRIIHLSTDDGYQMYDSTRFLAPELAASAVSPFCKSFTFLCHVRCLQRGDRQDAGNIYNNKNHNSNSKHYNHSGVGSEVGGHGEINRCSPVLDQTNITAVRILCICNNGVELTAEVSYALEGVVEPTGGDHPIRQVVYSTFTAYKAQCKTITRTKFKTATQVVLNTITTTTTVTTTVEVDRLTSAVTNTPVIEREGEEGREMVLLQAPMHAKDFGDTIDNRDHVDDSGHDGDNSDNSDHEGEEQSDIPH
ncbi:hypothetical protein EDD11_007377 [Mortierella claussenii]|nr:hypothetical protein EDD11_007377 [Mortierella claussenii]